MFIILGDYKIDYSTAYSIGRSPRKQQTVVHELPGEPLLPVAGPLSMS